jgi:hypothetical protein
MDSKLNARLNMAAIVRLDDDHGINLFEPDQSSLKKPSVLVKVLWAGLLHEKPSITLEEVHALVGGMSPAEFSAEVAAMMEQLKPDESTAETVDSAG